MSGVTRKLQRAPRNSAWQKCNETVVLSVSAGYLTLHINLQDMQPMLGMEKGGGQTIRLTPNRKIYHHGGWKDRSVIGT